MGQCCGSIVFERNGNGIRKRICHIAGQQRIDVLESSVNARAEFCKIWQQSGQLKMLNFSKTVVPAAENRVQRIEALHKLSPGVTLVKHFQAVKLRSVQQAR